MAIWWPNFKIGAIKRQLLSTIETVAFNSWDPNEKKERRRERRHFNEAANRPSIFGHVSALTAAGSLTCSCCCAERLVIDELDAPGPWLGPKWTLHLAPAKANGSIISSPFADVSLLSAQHLCRSFYIFCFQKCWNALTSNLIRLIIFINFFKLRNLKFIWTLKWMNLNLNRILEA